ncbi:taxifolin 8-monooxygenase [Malassezia cuniculi]|uniref:L-ornithine N(5)-monooxygenase [NAD(P)H] n=1 Tax=Malassezia cuniculi TaxID=948313 RepID=A0AAF0J4M6_9BASI|nr:taxifolin 8-monooxygenase [Malassezia cuniculi]
MAPIFDLVGVGFGPANLSLCIALHESEEARTKGFSMVFLEKQPQFAWHRTLLLPGTQLQVSPMKDLVTMRDPTSYFSFTNFLHVHGRLPAYINRSESVPSRREWSAYLAWAARSMEQYARYGTTVLDIEPVKGSDGKVAYNRVIARDASGNTHSYLARNVCVAVGGQANIPESLTSVIDAPRVIHSAQFLTQMKTLEPILRAKKSLRLAVLGAGQSSAEMLVYLLDRFPEAQIDMIFRASALVPSDDTPFVNSAAFDPASSQRFWELPLKLRRQHVVEFKHTNYSVVRADLIAQIYEAAYEERVELDGETSECRICIQPNTLVLNSEESGDQIVLHTRPVHVAEPVSNTFDAVFLGTGFVRDAYRMPFVDSLRSHFSLLSADGVQRLRESEEAFDNSGDAVADPEAERGRTRGITRDYFLVPDEPDAWNTTSETISSVPKEATENVEAPAETRDRVVSPRILVLGCNESTHGISDSLLSVAAHRAGIIKSSLLARTPE